MPALPLSSDYDGKSLRHYQVDKQTVAGYFFAVRLLRIMYCVHEPANVAGTWHSARFSAGTNLLPDRDILRAVMSRNKMVERKTELALVFLFYLRLVVPSSSSSSSSVWSFLSFSLSLSFSWLSTTSQDGSRRTQETTKRDVEL